MLYSSLIEKAMRFAAAKHAGDVRKGTTIPYLTHLSSVALILARSGFDDEEVLAAALLHDAIEDAGVSADDLAREFTSRISELVIAASEVKTDPAGEKLAWKVRKVEHLKRIADAPVEARAIVLADKLHNLGTLVDDLAGDPTVWNRFNSDRSEQIWYYRAVAECVGTDAALKRLRDAYQMCLKRLDSHEC